MEMIDKAAVVAELERLYNLEYNNTSDLSCGKKIMLRNILLFIDALEVRDPYERCVQYQSVEDGIRVHAETYSFNIDSELFPQLTKEQQKLWRKEIEYACISGGEVGVELARDLRYKENIEAKEVDLKEEIDKIWKPRFSLGWDANSLISINYEGFEAIAKHFFELGLKAQKGE